MKMVMYFTHFQTYFLILNPILLEVVLLILERLSTAGLFI